MPTAARAVLGVIAFACVELVFLLAGTHANAADGITNGCGDYKSMFAMLASKYGESPAFIAASQNGSIVTITINPKTRTWTLVVQPNADVMCMVNGGEEWGDAPPEIKALGVPGEPS